MVVRVLTDVGKVLRHRRADVHLPQRRAVGLGQQHRVVFGAAGGAKARHRHRDDAAAVQPHHVERVHHHDQRQRRVQPARQPHHRAGGARVAQARAQAGRLQRQDLFTALRQPALVLRHKGRGRDRPAQVKLAQRQRKVRNGQFLARLGVGAHAPAVGHQARHVHVRQRKTRAEPFGLRQQRAVFRDQVVACKHHVLAGLALPCVGVEVGAHQPPRLPRHQVPAVGGLAHHLVAGRQVDDHRRARGGQTLRRRRRHPQVLADLRAQHKVGQRVALKQLRGAQQRRLAAQRHLIAHLPRRGEVPRLVELRVVGQAALGHQTQQLASAQHRRAVVQRRAVPHGQAHRHHAVQLLRARKHRHEGFFRALQQRLRQEQVAAGVARKAQFREYDQPRALLRGLYGQFYRALRVERAVRHLKPRRGGANAQKSVLHTGITPLQGVFFRLMLV